MIAPTFYSHMMKKKVQQYLDYEKIFLQDMMGNQFFIYTLL